MWYVIFIKIIISFHCYILFIIHSFTSFLLLYINNNYNDKYLPFRFCRLFLVEWLFLKKQYTHTSYLQNHCDRLVLKKPDESNDNEWMNSWKTEFLSFYYTLWRKERTRIRIESDKLIQKNIVHLGFIFFDLDNNYIMCVCFDIP